MLALATDQSKGARRIVTDKWRAEATKRVNADARTRKDIAEACGTSGPYLSQLLSGKYETSAFIDALTVELGMNLPSEPAKSPNIRHLALVATDLEADDFEKLVDYAEMLRKISKSKK